MKKYEAPEIVLLKINGTEIFTSGTGHDPDQEITDDMW